MSTSEVVTADGSSWIQGGTFYVRTVTRAERLIALSNTLVDTAAMCIMRGTDEGSYAPLLEAADELAALANFIEPAPQIEYTYWPTVASSPAEERAP